ncbi:MAG: hypothetical protein R3322_00370 [Kiloniellales bacterium]|nr:hypothetical protein [Kiloniellales bacterium]
MDAATILSEIDRAQKVIAGAAVIDPKKELENNVYPLLRFIAAAIAQSASEQGDRVQAVEDAVAEYLSGGESILLPMLAGRIQGTLGIGATLCEMIRKLDVWTADAPMPTELANMVGAFEHAATVCSEMVEDVTIEDATDDDSDDDGDGDAQATMQAAPAGDEEEAPSAASS